MISHRGGSVSHRGGSNNLVFLKLSFIQILMDFFQFPLMVREKSQFNLTKCHKVSIIGNLKRG